MLPVLIDKVSELGPLPTRKVMLVLHHLSDIFQLKPMFFANDDGLYLDIIKFTE